MRRVGYSGDVLPVAHHYTSLLDCLWVRIFPLMTKEQEPFIIGQCNEEPLLLESEEEDVDDSEAEAENDYDDNPMFSEVLAAMIEVHG